MQIFISPACVELLIVHYLHLAPYSCHKRWCCWLRAERWKRDNAFVTRCFLSVIAECLKFKPLYAQWTIKLIETGNLAFASPYDAPVMSPLTDAPYPAKDGDPTWKLFLKTSFLQSKSNRGTFFSEQTAHLPASKLVESSQTWDRNVSKLKAGNSDNKIDVEKDEYFGLYACAR